MTYIPVAIMVCQLSTTAYPIFGYQPEIIARQVAVHVDDLALHPTGKIGAYYEHLMPFDTGHGFTLYLVEHGGCIKAPGYLSDEKRI